jgi:transposase
MRPTSYNETSNADRQRVVEAYVQGQAAQTIAQIMSIKRTTVNSIIKQYSSKNKIEKATRGGPRNSKLNQLQKNTIREWVDEDCSITLRKMKERCLANFSIDVSESTVSKVLRDFEYTVKRIQNQPVRRNDAVALAARREYANSFMMASTRVQNTRIYFLDEVGFNVSMRARRGRSQRGQRAVQVVPAIRSRNISVCCCMSKEGIYYYKAQTRPFNGSLFSIFLTELFAKFTEDNISGVLLIMDNVPFHCSNNTVHLVQSNGHAILFLPPYLPFLNPIENMFAKWKEYVRRESPTNEERLFELIENGANLITNDDCNSFYMHMTTFFPDCLGSMEIVDETL